VNELVTAGLPARLEQLVRGPESPGQRFLCGSSNRDTVYAMAGQLRRELADESAPVCLASDDKTVLAAALLAALCGTPPLLLPPALSGNALARTRELTGFTVLITDKTDETTIPPDCRIVRPDPVGEATLPHPCPPPDPEAELLRIFTGGSTGTPQIWSKSVANIFGEGLFLTDFFGIRPDDAIVATVPPYHIYGLLFSVILPLVSGAGIVPETPVFAGNIEESVRSHHATVLVAVPPHYRVLHNTVMPPALRLAISSAGMLDKEDSLAFAAKNRTGVVEVYGSTETGGIATRNRSRGEEAFTPFPPVEWHEHLGRLAVRSPFLSADLSRTDSGFFLTADKIEIRDRGFVLKGRSDHVTKVGGRRVDLDEIREQVKKIPGVTDALVLAVPEAGGRENLIAALVETAEHNSGELRNRLAGQLEPHAVPRILKTVDRLPVRENGKYDRQAAARLLRP
jgi:acyl-coenzyme A synthetase/AMP-(fatty) acid ligase